VFVLFFVFRNSTHGNEILLQIKTLVTYICEQIIFSCCLCIHICLDFPTPSDNNTCEQIISSNLARGYVQELVINFPTSYDNNICEQIIFSNLARGYVQYLKNLVINTLVFFLYHFIHSTILSLKLSTH
jgi:hypothetical protein